MELVARTDLSKEEYDRQGRDEFDGIHPLRYHQFFLKTLITPLSPYRRLLLFHDMGTGKTISALQIALNFVEYGRKVVVYAPSKSKTRRIFRENLKKMNERFHIEYKSYQDKIENKCKKWTDRVIIFDEFHHILQTKEEHFAKFKKMIDCSKHCMFLFLSGTPVYDNISQFMRILMLLDDEDILQEIRYGIRNFKLEDVLKFKNIFKQILIDKTSFFNPSPGDNCPLTKFVKNNNGEEVLMDELCYFECPRSVAFMKEYALKFPCTSKSNKRDDLMQQQKKRHLTFTSKHSFKLQYLVDNIGKCEGNVFVYTEGIDIGCTDTVKILLANGYEMYSPGNNTPSPKMICINSRNSGNNASIDVFNSDANEDGKLIKVIIGTRCINEGISLRNLGSVHLLDDWFNVSRMKQIIRRGSRYKCSKYSTIKVYIYVDDSVDRRSYAEEKIDMVNKVTGILQECSFEYLYRKAKDESLMSYASDYSFYENRRLDVEKEIENIFFFNQIILYEDLANSLNIDDHILENALVNVGKKILKYKRDHGVASVASIDSNDSNGSNDVTNTGVLRELSLSIDSGKNKRYLMVIPENMDNSISSLSTLELYKAKRDYLQVNDYSKIVYKNSSLFLINTATRKSKLVRSISQQEIKELASELGFNTQFSKDILLSILTEKLKSMNI